MAFFDGNFSPPSVKLGRMATIRFNILAVGEGGLGKRTFLKSLASAYTKSSPENYSYKSNNNLIGTTKNGVKQKVSIKESDHFMLTSELWDCEIRMLEANGFGDFIDNTDAVAVIKQYVASAHNEWCNLNCNEVTDQERNQADNRVHCIFYFLNPHKIKELDTMFFKELHDLAVIVPIVAKSDAMTMCERKAYLQAVHFHIRSLQQHLGGRWDVIFNFEEAIPSPDSRAGEETAGEGRQRPDVHCGPLPPSPPDSCGEGARPFPLSVTPGAPYSREAAGNTLLEVIELVGEPSEADSEDYAVSSGAAPSPVPSPKPSPLGRRSPGGLEEIDYSHAFLSEINAEIAVDADNLLRVSCVESPYSSPSPSPTSAVRMSMAPSESESESVLDAAEGLPKVPNIFAIICSSGGGAERVYPWGSVSVRDEGCSDFRRLLRQLFEAEKIAVMREATQKRSIAFNRQRRPSPRPPLQASSLWQGSESVCRWLAESKKWLFSAEFFPTLVLALNLTMLVLAMTEIFYWTSSPDKSC